MDARVTDWLQATGSLVSRIATVAVFWQLIVARNQLANGNTWNKINATFTFFRNDDFMERERAAVIALAPLGMNLYQQMSPLEPEMVAKIWKDQKIHS